MTAPGYPPNYQRLDRLHQRFTTLETSLDTAREALYAAIIRHLNARNARPGNVADHSPWDRVWISGIARKAGVPPVKGPNAVGPPPVYDPDTEAAALAELDKLTAAYRKAEKGLEDLVPLIHQEIRRKHREEGRTPAEITPHTPYEANWVGDICRGTVELSASGGVSRRRASSRKKRSAAE
ncbi:hypothetical protein [Streptomyces sp. AD55]|uniref:hypothetical protein n=1 Tax=Streptomyces sp. AD55 TaxID=3242895 RepID=UPI003528022E